MSVRCARWVPSDGVGLRFAAEGLVHPPWPVHSTGGGAGQNTRDRPTGLRTPVLYAVYCYQELCNNGIGNCTSSIRIARHYRTTPSLTASLTRLSLPLSALELSPGPRAPASTHSIKLLGATGDSSHHHESARPT